MATRLTTIELIREVTGFPLKEIQAVVFSRSTPTPNEKEIEYLLSILNDDF